MVHPQSEEFTANNIATKVLIEKRKWGGGGEREEKNFATLKALKTLRAYQPGYKDTEQITKMELLCTKVRLFKQKSNFKKKLIT